MNPIPTIVIVDDDEDVRLSTESLMRSIGCRAAAYGTPHEALSSPTLGQADCLITDLQLPGMNGLDLQACLRRRGIDIPVIVITAFPDDRLRRRSKEVGVFDFLEEPFAGDRLIDSIN